MSDHIGCPGPGGSLGQCAVCGQSFLKEVIFGKNVRTFSVGGLDAILYAHDPDCVNIVKEINEMGGDWRKLPPGPLRKAYQEANGKAEIVREAAAPTGEKGEKP